jgi:putative hydrolase of HD superfamily
MEMTFAPAPERLGRQIAFIVEIDKLKHILRQTMLIDGSRQENDAEHSWHLSIMAMVLSEYAAQPVDILKVIKMVLVHDLVEIDAGDTYIYDEKGNADKAEREQKAADRIFTLLPPPGASELRACWEEFEARQTPEALFAAALDRLQPLLHNFHSEGRMWRQHGITSDRVLKRNQPFFAGAPGLWLYARELIEESVRRGYLKQ